MAEALVPKLAEFSQVFKIYCDASPIGIRGVQSQAGHPIANYNEKLNDTMGLSLLVTFGRHYGVN